MNGRSSLDEATAVDGGERRLQTLPNPGDVVDNRYVVLTEIGEGGFGWVFKVQHKLLGQHFAMKILHPEISSDPDWRARFREEARSTSLIGHESIVFVTDFGECPTHGYYFIMEYLDGKPLASLLTHEPLDLQLTMRFAMAAASALGAVHELGIVHCDLKPENVMLIERPGRNESWKFLDFGTSNVVTRSADSAFVYGTPAYMAPEQAAGADVDGRADQFSLACVIYEMLTGQTPWIVREWADASPANRRKHEPRPVSTFRDDVSKAFDEAMARALSVRRNSRYDSVEAFVTALRDAMEEVEFEPALDPQDLKVNARGFERSFTAPRIEQTLDAGESMVISLGESSEPEMMAPEVNIVFHTVDRLAREYRRNILAGGMFVPSPMVLPIASPVRLNLTLLPRQMAVELDAKVTSRSVMGGPAEVGFGVVFTPESQKKLERWLRNPLVGLELRATDVLSRVKELDPADTSISAAEAFMVSMIQAPVTVQRLRSICAGLPVDFNEAVASLLQKQYIHIETAESTEASPEPLKMSAGSTHFGLTDVNRVLEQCDFYERQQNFWAAISSLNKVLEVMPDQPELLFRLAKLEYKVRGNRTDALRYARRAVVLKPHTQSYRDLVSELEGAG